MLKEIFNDGILRIVLLLSLVRTDWNNYLNTINSHDTSQDIILGPLSGITQTDLHNNDWTTGSYSPVKNIDNYRENIIHDLHQLGRYHRFEGVDTDISAFLANEPGPVQLLSENAEANPTVAGSQAEANSAEPVGTCTSDQAVPSGSRLPGSDLTKEVIRWLIDDSKPGWYYFLS